MIQRYFITGLRVKWAQPSQVPGPKDGSIAINPPKPPAYMKYDGMDGQLVGTTHVSSLGLTKGQQIPFQWLCYVHGRTAKVSASSDILTGPMSGCFIASWTEGGRRWVGHVGTVTGEAQVNENVKTTFANFMPQDTTAFNPSDAWPDGEISSKFACFKNPRAGFSIFALVTPTNDFFSLLLFNLIDNERNNYVIGGCKEVQPMNYETLRARLIPTRGRSNSTIDNTPTRPRSGAISGR